MNIGFNNGAFHRLSKHHNDRWEPDIYKRLAHVQANSIEFHIRGDDNDVVSLYKQIQTNDLSFYRYISIHAPAIKYQDDVNTRKLLDGLVRIHEYQALHNIVFHPDTVQDWSIIAEYADRLPISIENMDDRKSFGKTVVDIASILDIYPFGLTLDVQHCYTNDTTMQLAYDFHERFGDRIVEYHLSGYDKRLLHVALFDRGQDEIIKAIKLPKIPIIIESTFDKFGDEDKEIKYILKTLTP